MTNGTFATKSSSCCVSGVESKKITREQVITLRNISVQKDSIRKMTELLLGGWRGLLEAMSAPLHTKNTNSMCKYYGHIIQGSWEGAFPKCRDCG
ncbi:MAG: hypothetical protein K2X27_27590 [Candidatus Obscuribacterales bacterium]|nr:hypothetical protein [Candidatus Obscuribacterales bacterium]